MFCSHLSGNCSKALQQNSTGINAKYFQRTFKFGFSRRSVSTPKYFALIENGNNRLVQEQLNMAYRVEQTKRVPKSFSIYF